jgi:ABC-type enterochelin transport system substrate-binding protein
MTTTVNNSVKKAVTGMMALMMVFLFNACAKKSTAVAKTETPAVTEAPATTTVPDNIGQVQIKRDVNSNYVIQINVQDLKEISSLDPNSKNAYIVWMDADNQAVKSLGQINNNTGWLSDKSKATFEAVSAAKPTRILITSEDNAGVKTPGKMVIWTTSRF